MKKSFATFLGAIAIIALSSIQADAQGLEGIIVETYYTTNAADAVPVFGIPGPEVGSTTYRVFVDLAPNYRLQQVSGLSANPLQFTTTTGFYNPTGASVQFAGSFNSFTFSAGSIPLDSYFSLGIAGPLYAGVPKVDDTNGSIFTTRLQNTVNPINVSDGLAPSTPAQLDPQVIGSGSFNAVNVNGASSFFESNTTFFNLAGSKGILPQNKILIAQFTTTGDFSFKINLAIVSDDVPPVVEFYTHSNVADNDGNPSVIYPALTYPLVIQGCTNPQACNFNVNAGNDDGSCLIPEPNCTACSGILLVLIDSDNDGICNANEVPGCTSASACNFDFNATDNNGTCIEPVANCQACNPTNTGLVIIDTDGDGICNANEVAGCTNLVACNYNANATDDNGSCLIPVPNCQVCNASNTALVIVDSDGDGVCDAQEVEGCTIASACNFNPTATNNNGSCIVPVSNCQACNASNTGLIIIDSDGDGLCNAQDPCPQLANLVNGDACMTNMGENGIVADCNCVFTVVPGCTSTTACNYDVDANQNNGSCIEPVANCQACNATNDGLVIIDTDGDGVCNAQEIAGCTSNTACNFNLDATDEDGSCIEPVANCQACNSMNTGLVIVDSDGDGVCDAEEQLGCTVSAACNYQDFATEDDGTCILPEANCSICNATNTGLDLIDSDSDGICDANEILGCTSSSACNYNPLATDNSGFCIEPELNCFICNPSDTGLVIVDSDGDGVCDASEVLGCTIFNACNYDSNATDESGDCILPIADCFACNADNTGLVIIDADGDGICNADEIPGCTNPDASNYNPEATDDDGSCVLSIADRQALSSFIQVYPNPTADRAFVKFDPALVGQNDLVISITDILGQLVFSSKVQGLTSELVFEIDVSKFTDGIYVLNISSDKLSGTVRFVKQY